MLKALKQLMRIYRSNRLRKRYLRFSRKWINLQIAFEEAKPDIEKRLEELYDDYQNHKG